MSSYALVENGVVQEVVEVPPGTPTLRQRYHPSVLPNFIPIVPESLASQIGSGWLWDGSAFTAPQLSPQVLVPAEVTNYQARAVMRQFFLSDGQSLFTAVNTMLLQARAAAAALPEIDPQRVAADTAWQAWEQANHYTRGGVLMNQLAAQFGLEPEQVDALFIAAAAVEA